MKRGGRQILGLACASAFIFLSGCDKGSDAVVSENRAGAAAVDAVENVRLDGTRYSDGRKTTVRDFQFFEFYRDKTAAPDPASIKLGLVVVEWGRYDALVADGESVFGQLPSNLMVGGDVETNQRVRPSASAFFANARAAFAARRNSLMRIERAVPNRNSDRVSFDFVTNQGTFTVQQDLAALENGTSPWSALFREAGALREKVERSLDRFQDPSAKGKNAGRNSDVSN